MITLEQAKALVQGQYIYSTVSHDFSGNPHRMKVTSVKTWKTRPGDVEVRWKWGLYVYGSFFFKNGICPEASSYALTNGRGE